MTSTANDQANAYSARQRVKEDNREIDARALLNCASRLKAALDDKGTDKNAYADAIKHNQKLWTFFQVAVNDPENLLPRDLKVIIFNLSLYVDKVSFAALTGYSASTLESLISINRKIAAGLSIKPKTEATLSAAENIPSQPAAVRTTA